MRWRRVAIAVAVGFAGVLVLATFGEAALHHWRVWRNGGVWCFPIDSTDSRDIRYGEDCP